MFCNTLWKWVWKTLNEGPTLAQQPTVSLVCHSLGVLCKNHIENANSLYFKDDNSTPLACNMLRSCENSKVELFEALLFSSLCCRSASTTPSGSPCSSQQSVYQSGEASGPSAGAPSSWNPFGDDNFSKLTAEELLNKDFAKLDGKSNVYIWN